METYAAPFPHAVLCVSDYGQSADSCILFFVTLTQRWTRNMVVKGGSQRQITFMGVDSAVVCLSVVLSTPMSVIWRCEPPFTTMFRVKR